MNVRPVLRSLVSQAAEWLTDGLKAGKKLWPCYDCKRTRYEDAKREDTVDELLVHETMKAS